MAANNPMSPALSSLDEILGPRPELLALGEPAHGEPVIQYLRNDVFRTLAGRGFRSIAVESDLIAALTVDAYVRDGAGTLDRAMTEGFSHAFGELAANRELVACMRAYNDGRTPDERLAFHGIDPPLENTSAPSPRRYLQHMRDYLAEHVGPDAFLHGRTDLAPLLGDDEHWSRDEAVLEADKSPGASPEARTLRAIADDLLTSLYAHAPRLVAATSLEQWQRAEMHGRTAIGLLRYHSQLTEPLEQPERISRMLAVRDALMAENLLAVRERERHRGPTLVFAHNRHLQRHHSTMRMAGMDLDWLSAGSITTTLSAERYTVIAGSIGTSPALGLDAPPAGTYEDAFQRAAHEHAYFDGARLRTALDVIAPHVRTDVRPEQGHFPLDAGTLATCDAVLHAASGRDQGYS